MQIKRTNKTDAAAPTLALRHLAKRLREELHIKHPPHKAIECLIRVALGLDREIPARVVANALRLKMQTRTQPQAAKLAISDNSLKNKAASKRAAR